MPEIFKKGQRAKMVTGEPVTVIDILPIGLAVVYLVELESGKQRYVAGEDLREV